MSASSRTATLEVVDDGRTLVISSAGATTTRLPALWLRDNAPDDRDPGNGQKLTNITDLPSDPRITAIETSTASSISLTFSPDNMTATFAIDNLIATSARDEAGPRTWSRRDFEQGPPKACWERLSAEPAHLTTWLAGIRDHGFAVLTNLPDKQGMVLEVAERFGFVRETNYGRLFDVRAEVNPVNLAYTGMALSVHTDNPYRDPVPGIQLLHCLRNDSAGGETVLVDGFNAAEHLRLRDKSAFDILSRTWVRFTYRSGNTELTARRPMINVDDHGRVIEVRFNNRSLAPLDIAMADAPAFYDAYRRFAECLFDPDAALSFKLEPGELFAVDNRRMLHGRTAFSSAGQRHLQGCYVDMDGLLSRLAVLERDQA